MRLDYNKDNLSPMFFSFRLRFPSAERQRFPYYKRQCDGNLDLPAILFQTHWIVGER